MARARIFEKSTASPRTSHATAWHGPCTVSDGLLTMLADRFVRDSRRPWTDLATGRSVRLRIVEVPASASQQSRLRRGDALSSLWHPHLLTPIDHGLVGQDRWFEAWPAWSAAERAGAGRMAEALRSAVSFLHAHHLSAGRAGLKRAGLCDGEIVLLPDANTGQALVTDLAVGAEARAWGVLLKRWSGPPNERIVGLRIETPPLVKWIADVLDDARPGDVRNLAVCGRGWSTFRLMVARVARARGFVPVDLKLLNRWTHLAGVVRDRHLLLLADESPGMTSAGALVSYHLHRSNACVIVRRVVQPGDRAQREDGARFVELVSVPSGMPAGIGRSQSWAVHEASVRYSAETDGRSATARAAVAGASASEPDARRARHCAERATVLMERGRHAAAERSYRKAIGALERRGLRGEAGVWRLTLAEHLARRGRVDQALELLTQRQAHGDLKVSVRTAVRIASLLTDQARLTEAESSARWARIAARESGEGTVEVHAAAALARCLFWQGRVDEAAACLPIESENARTLDVRVCAERARIALAQADLAAAGRAASSAVRIAAGLRDPSIDVAAHRAMAGVQSSIGDESRFKEHIRRAGEAARAGRAPLDRVRVQLTLGEGAVTLGLRGEWDAVDRSLRRWERRSVPALLRTRVQHLRGRLGQPDAAMVGQRAADAHGIGMLLRQNGLEVRRMDALQELADILQICHESPDDRTALTRTCAALRDRLRARCVGMVAPDGGAVAGTGQGWCARSAMADRVVASGQATGPALEDGGLEAATPVRYAGRTIAVLSGRWPVDCVLDQSAVLAILSAAAAASAPSARALLDRLATTGSKNPVAVAVPALLGTSHAIELVRQAAIRAARAPFSVLVEGESGSGKELVARAIHTLSERRDRRFCTINCAALSDDLIEAELFGHARGAFTGAVAERPGLFEDADQGTLLLDELSELSPRAQAKLLRTLQDGEVRRVGENLPRRVDVRIIGASNRSLAEEVASGRFRADLRYRLDVIRITVPPLRERVEDIPLLAAHFWDQATRRTHSRATLDPETLAALARYDWPGNVRELQNAMTALAVQAGSRGRVGPRALPEHLSRACGPNEPARLDQARRSFERRFVRATLAQVGGHRGRAAQTLGLTRQGLAKLLKRLEIEQPVAAADESVRAVS